MFHVQNHRAYFVPGFSQLPYLGQFLGQDRDIVGIHLTQKTEAYAARFFFPDNDKFFFLYHQVDKPGHFKYFPDRVAHVFDNQFPFAGVHCFLGLEQYPQAHTGYIA